jgi:aminoglycoside 3-N-acetyltransferase
MNRSWPGSSRSDHPAASFAALGPHAVAVTHAHLVEDMFGERSPLGKLYELDAWILLLGVGHESNTSLHLAEARTAFAGKRFVDDGSAMLVGGRRAWVQYRHVDWDSDDFVELGAEYESQHASEDESKRESKHASKQDVAVHPAGSAGSEMRLLRMRPLVDWACRWLERRR